MCSRHFGDAPPYDVITMTEIDVRADGRTPCDDCGQVLPAGTPIVAYSYWDLPGPEYVCWDCKPEHDRQDKEYGYR